MPQPVENPPAFVGPPKKLDFEFKGTGREYFRIWLTNTLLSICTLGIYSAWAKVRKKQYLYANTYLDGHAFEYTGDPKKILKGRVAAAVPLAAVYFFWQYNVWLAGCVIAMMILGYPWILRQSIAFNLRNSSHRNIRFGFEGSGLGAYRVYLLWNLIGVLTLGIMLPYAWYKQQQYLVGNTKYGQVHFKHTGRPKQYYRAGLDVFFMAFFIVSCLFVVLFFVIPMYQYNTSDLPLPSIQNPILTLIWAANFMITSLLFGMVRINLLILALSHSQLSQVTFRAEMDNWNYASLSFVNKLKGLLSLGIFIPWARIRIHQFIIKGTCVIAPGSLDEFAMDAPETVSPLADGAADIWDFDVSL